MSKTLVLSRIFPPQVGGNGHWMNELYSRLPRDEYVVATSQHPEGDAFDAAHHLPIVRLPMQFESWGALGLRRGAAYCRVFRQLCQIVRQRRITSIHASNILPEGFLAWMLHRRLGLPYILYVHGEELNIADSSGELRWMARRAYRDARLIVANSRNSARLLIDGWPVSADRLRVMHPGVSAQDFRPAPRSWQVRRDLGWHDRPVILTVGRLMKRKGHESVLRALPAIRKAVPDVLYAIVGDGDERENLERLASELALQDHVIMHGELQGGEVLRAFQQGDVFVLANREVAGDFEGFGIVLLEAQACGMPVVAGCSGGTAEAMNAPETGRLVRGDSPEELSSVLSTLLLDPDLRHEMGAAGRNWVERRFDWEILADDAYRVFTGSPRIARRELLEVV